MHPIVVVAYNRSKSLLRLLTSLANASYPDTPILLIISIDYADDNQATLKVANDFNWNFGEKRIVTHETNLGLRKHVLKCGSYAITYGSAIILEDDLCVSPNFYHYTDASLDFSKDHKDIGGISLYNHLINVHTVQSFSPIEDGYDNWYFQFASSWGQAWTKNQFERFLEWYNNNQTLTIKPTIPKNVTNWSDKSWLKYFITYLIETNTFFLYPKISLSTNFGDAGTHINSDSTVYQVPLLQKIKKKYNFSTLKESSSVYDAFFENIGLYKVLNLEQGELLVDLYGLKEIGSYRYVLSKKIYDFKILRKFRRSLRPMEANIIFEIEGNDLFLYDTTISEVNILKESFRKEMVYHLKYITHRNAYRLFLKMTKSRISSWFNK